MIKINELKILSLNINKIDNKRSNRLTKVRFEFNKLIKDVNNVVFAATNEILINEN